MTSDGATPAASSSAGDDRLQTRAICVFGLALLLSLKGDGRFPLPEGLGEPAFQLLLLPYTAALCALVGLYLCPPRSRLPICSWPSTALVLALVLEAVWLLVLGLQSQRYAAFGYGTPPPVAYAVIAVAAAAFLVAAARSDKASRFIGASVRIYVLGQALSIVYFPLHPDRSDMLPLIAAAGRRLLAGGQAYGWYALPHQLPLTYLPGTWLAFLPAVALGLDPRVVELVCIVAATLVAYHSTAPLPAARWPAATLLSLFLLNPYLQYRHELYLGPLWLAVALSFAALSRRRLIAGGLAFGWALASSQFAWVVAPFLAVHLARQHGLRRALGAVAAALAVVGLLVAPFFREAPAAFMAGVFGHWQGTAGATTANLSYWVLRVVPADLLPGVQATLVLGLLALSWRRTASLAHAALWMALALFVFTLFNPLIWVYFYLSVFFLLVAAATMAEPADATPGGSLTPGQP